MPALKLCDRPWHLGSDDVPFFAAWGAIFHCAWVLLIAITGQVILLVEGLHDVPQSVLGTLFN
jgi:hypothetical protein